MNPKILKYPSGQTHVAWDEIPGASSYLLKLCDAETPDVYVDTEVQTPEHICEEDFDKESVRVIISALDDKGAELDVFSEVIAIAMSSDTHANVISNPFNLNFNAEESVNLNTGAAVYKTNVLTLPGRGGFDFNLDLIYDSSEAEIRKPALYGGSQTTDRSRWHDLGVGWRFDLPYINRSSSILYLPGRGSFPFWGFTFADRSLQDMRLGSGGSFTSGNLRTTIMLQFHNGTSYFFYRQLIIGMADRYGNTIRFEYEAAPLQPAGRRLTRIIDTN
ncbi:MAG: hypothetical protein FWF78_00115, partial [Defluviitaleaceae bacterium]|nr:hypothetical protein [Defluviitaleaceae bacterium]